MINRTRSCVRTFISTDKAITNCKYQPVVVLEKIRSGRVSCSGTFQDTDGYVKIKSEMVQGSSDSSDTHQVNEEEELSSLDLHLSPDSPEVSGVIVEEFCSESTHFSTDDSPCNQNAQEFSSGQEPSQDEINRSLKQSSSQDMLQDSNLSSRGHSVDQNRERTEEWSSQELSNFSLRLRRRREQVKRMFTEVIRKRQITDETLEVVKKRLRKL